MPKVSKVFVKMPNDDNTLLAQGFQKGTTTRSGTYWFKPMPTANAGVAAGVDDLANLLGGLQIGAPIIVIENEDELEAAFKKMDIKKGGKRNTRRKTRRNRK